MMISIPTTFRKPQSTQGVSYDATISTNNIETKKVLSILNEKLKLSWLERTYDLGVFEVNDWSSSEDRSYGLGQGNIAFDLLLKEKPYLTVVIPEKGESYVQFHPEIPKPFKDFIMTQI